MALMDIGLGIATGGMYNMNKALLGGMGNMFGGGGAPNFDSIIQERQKQIQDFQNQLNIAQGNILNNYQNLQTNTINRYMPDLTAYLAGRGISANGGAFASAVAHEASGLQGMYDMKNADITQQNLSMVGNMQSQLFGQTLGLQSFPQMANYQNKMGMQQAFGGLLGTAAGSFLGPLGSMAGGQLGRSMFGGGSGGGGMMSGFGVNPGGYGGGMGMFRNGSGNGLFSGWRQ